MDRIDGLLEALLSRESLNEGDKQCRHCDQGHWAVWRCRDCALGVPMCRGCMRASHMANPFHRIERWNGGFFRSADLWEVGIYVLVQHHSGTPLCETLTEDAAGASVSALPFLGTYLRVVHSNGIHDIAMVSCECRGHNITLFTVQLLDIFRLCNLELKASAYQFYQLLRRLTTPTAPAGVVDLYRELKWAGYGTDSKPVDEVKAGELAIFCPACPQPGINIPAEWLEDPARHVLLCFFVADGNFKADHVQQKKAAGDVWLSEGSGMIPRSQEYLSFLKSALERLTKAPCENTFRAIMNSLQASKACDVMGVVGIACARHGCYAPNALVDLFKGEQQKNVDFAFLKALTSTRVEPEQGVLLIYDIACQYFVHLQDRIGNHLPFGLEVEAAIGLFHVHAHKDQCFFRYASSFIPGAGSLWSSLNSISPTARTATLAHRAEMLDDHATDSNHKKMLGMVMTLCKSNSTAIDMLDHAQSYYQNLTMEAGSTAVEKWNIDIVRAEERRTEDITAMDIYAAKLDTDSLACRLLAAGVAGSALRVWMELSLAVEEKQLYIQAKVRQLARSPASADWQGIEKDREGLSPLMLQLKQAQQMAGVTEMPGSQTTQSEMLDIWDDIITEPVHASADVPEKESIPALAPAPAEYQRSPASCIGPCPIEDQHISLPSNGNISAVHGALECSHRVSLAEHHLNQIRNLIAEKSFQFSHVIRVSPCKGVTTRSRAAVNKLNLQIALHCRLYSRCRAHVIALGADPATQAQLQPLRPEDVKASTAIVNPNEPGSTRLTLSWIWQMAGGHHLGLVANIGAGATSDSVSEFRRVHWLRARAQLMRWQEEVTLTRHEMQWTVAFFAYNSRKWDVQSGSTTGAITYAKHKQAMWLQLAVRADQTFC
ncbi:hypothetical protein BYT27DRAFT_7221743 [Phlegmacium glaucopus]|nr:hypothetical protein BYT27DRAFT_7221743 [Phlegmacium glaucopus]